jgi:hypothetical protein
MRSKKTKLPSSLANLSIFLSKSIFWLITSSPTWNVQSCLKISGARKFLYVILTKLGGRYSLGSTLYL